MPIFDDRFARQNRCEPPPEFPLASPYTGIVHHLSGPSGKALTQILRQAFRIGRWCAEAPTYVHFHFACGFVTQTLAPMLDSLVRVSRRVAGDHYASILARRRGPRSPQGYDVQGYNTPERATFPEPLSPCRETDAGLSPAERTGNECQMIRRAQVWSQALPFQQFHVLFNSLFKVLFIFRSLYLCAIGLWPIFSFRRNLPPILSSIPKLLDSSKELRKG